MLPRPVYTPEPALPEGVAGGLEPSEGKAVMCLNRIGGLAIATPLITFLKAIHKHI